MIFVHLLAAIDMAGDGNVIMNVKDCGILENEWTHFPIKCMYPF